MKLQDILEKEVSECIITDVEQLDYFLRDTIEYLYPELTRFVEDVDFESFVHVEYSRYNQDGMDEYEHYFDIPKEIEYKFRELYPEEFI